MKMKSFKRVLALALASAMIFTACGKEPVSHTSESEVKVSETEKETETTAAIEESTETVINKEDLPILTFYPESEQTFSGLLEGWRGDILAEAGFQMEYWSYSTDKTNAMLISGDLPDMMVVKAGTDAFDTLIEQGKLINYDDYKEYLPNIYDNPPNEWWTEEQFEFSRENCSNGTGNMYLFPSAVGWTVSHWKDTNVFDRNVVKLKWDVYEAIGAPEIKDVWELIDVMEAMLKHQPTLEDGTKMYGTFLDNGQDTKYFGAMQLWYRWDGYDNNIYQYFIEGKVSTGEINSILTKDSKYYEGLKWYNEVYRRGLMDPDSISTSRSDQAPKLDAGLAMVPSGTLPGAPTKYYEYFMPGFTVYSDFCTEQMPATASGIVINKDTEHLEECLKFINMIADPYTMLQLNYGPEGEMWQKDDNVLSITDEFAAWLEEKGSVNFFPMSDGTEWYPWYGGTLVGASNAVNGYVGVNGEEIPLMVYIWPDALAITDSNDNWNAWKKTMNADSLFDYCEKNDIEVCTSSAFTGLVLPKPDEAQSLQISTIKDVVVTQSWLCVYAKTDEEFDAAWDKLVKDAMELGAQEIIDWRIKCYEDAFAAQK